MPVSHNLPFVNRSVLPSLPVTVQRRQNFTHKVCKINFLLLLSAPRLRCARLKRNRQSVLIPSLSGLSLYPLKIIFKWVFINFFCKQKNFTNLPTLKIPAFFCLPYLQLKNAYFHSGVPHVPKGKKIKKEGQQK